jgi:RND family efflux transporter MFP subunit
MINLKPVFPLFLASLTLAGCEDKPTNTAQEKTPPAVLVQKITFTESAVEQTLAATIRSRVVSDHAFRISGKVMRRLVNVGDRVKAGAPLAEIDSSDLKLQQQQAEAEFSAAKKALSQQTTEQSRVARLAKRGWAAAAALDKQNVAADEAQARLDRAEQAVSLARNAIVYTMLIADADGVVTDTAVEPGQFTAAGQKAISIANVGELEALAAIPESQVTEIATGRATLNIWSDASRRYPLKLRELSPIADPATRTFAARFTINSPDNRLRLGMSAQIHVSGAEARRAAVPLSAILDEGKGPGVWTVNQATGQIKLKPVTVARMGASQVDITSGVADGEIIVAMGAQKLDAGLKVRPVKSLER